MPMCTHLSKYTSDNQSSLGNAEPGRQNKIVKKINAPTGKIRLWGLVMISEKMANDAEFFMPPSFDKTQKIGVHPAQMDC